MKRVITATVLFLFLTIQPGYGQAPYFQNYFLLRKNEPIQVNTIFQDHIGFMWYGTNKGLFKFDGISQKRFTIADSLPDNNVTALAEDSLGRIWAGCKNGQLAFIENNIIKKFNPAEGSASQQISDILFDKMGILWFSTLNDGLYYFEDNRLQRLDDTDGMPDLFIYDIAEDQQGKIWAGTDGGVVACILKDKKVTMEIVSYKQGLPDNIIKKIIIDKDNSLWLATEDAGIIHYDPVTKTNSPLIDKDWSLGTVTDFLLSGDKMWISTLQTGLIVYDRTTGLIKVYKQNPKTGFISPNTLLQDAEGNIWMGSKTGVVRTYGDYIEYLTDFEQVKDQDIIAITIDKEQNIWFANSEGLFKREMNGGKTSVDRQLSGTPYKNYSVISLFTDSQGYIWAGLYGEGVLRINPSTGKIRYLNKELRNGNILNITGKNNEVWLATLGGATQIKISGDQLDVKNYSNADGLISDYIYQIFIDSKNRKWFATDGKGVGMLDESGFHHYSEGLNSKVIYGFTESNNHVWVNAQGDGLYQWDGTKFILHSTNALLHDNNISCLSTDQSDRLVMMHDLGIEIYNPKNAELQYFGDEVGINERKANLNAITRDQYGRLLIGTTEGILIYSENKNRVPHQPRPNITSLKVFDKMVSLSPGLKFTYDQNNITINYLGFWYKNPKDLMYEYRLENYDIEWIASHDRFAVYSSLPPGEYNFQLKASDTGSFKEAEIKSFHFVVKSPFWRTIPFYVLVVIVTAFAGYSFLRFRERILIRNNQRLEAKVAERTHEIQMKNEEILSQAEEIKSMNDNLEELVEERTSELERKNKALEEYAFIIAHNLRGPVASILGLINLISKTELRDQEKEMLSHLQDSAEKLDRIVHSITEAIEKGDS